MNETDKIKMKAEITASKLDMLASQGIPAGWESLGEWGEMVKQLTMEAAATIRALADQ